MSGGEPCKECGVETNGAHHTILFEGGDPTKAKGDFWMCCRCHVRDGNPPADWHPGCIKAAMEKKAEIQRRN